MDLFVDAVGVLLPLEAVVGFGIDFLRIWRRIIRRRNECDPSHMNNKRIIVQKIKRILMLASYDG